MKTTGRVSLLEAHIPVAVGRRGSFFLVKKLAVSLSSPVLSPWSLLLWCTELFVAIYFWFKVQLDRFFLRGMAAKNQLSGMFPHQAPWFRWIHPDSCAIAAGVGWTLTPRSLGSVSLGAYSSSSSNFIELLCQHKTGSYNPRQNCWEWNASSEKTVFHYPPCMHNWNPVSGIEKYFSLQLWQSAVPISFANVVRKVLYIKAFAKKFSFFNTYMLHAKHLLPTLGSCEIPVRTLGSLNTHTHICTSDVKCDQHQYLHNWVNSDFVHILLCRLLHQVRGNKAEPSEKMMSIGTWRNTWGICRRKKKMASWQKKQKGVAWCYNRQSHLCQSTANLADTGEYNSSPYRGLGVPSPFLSSGFE